MKSNFVMVAVLSIVATACHTSDDAASEVQSLDEAQSITQRSDGMYDVECQSGDETWTEVVSQEDITSNNVCNTAYSNLPADLRSIASKYNTLVSPPDEYEEYGFTMETVEFEGSQWEASTQILTFEAERATNIIDDFHMIDLDVNHNGAYPEAVMAKLFDEGNYGHFFCYKYRTIGEEFSHDNLEPCKEATMDLLEDVAGQTSLGGHMVTVDGDYYGDFKYLSLYLRSDEDPSKALRLYFDILHEI